MVAIISMLLRVFILLLISRFGSTWRVVQYSPCNLEDDVWQKFIYKVVELNRKPYTPDCVNACHKEGDECAGFAEGPTSCYLGHPSKTETILTSLQENTSPFYLEQGNCPMPSCYIKKNMDWQGGDTHKKDGVYSMGECQDWCRQKDSKHFVWAKTFCVCKDAVTGERSSNCCDSGEATGCSGYILVDKENTITCNYITTSSECEAAARELGLADTSATPSPITSLDNWADPPYCYIEGGSLKFNGDGTNTGACGFDGGWGAVYLDKCLCKFRG